jgi:hypothetical protein
LPWEYPDQKTLVAKSYNEYLKKNKIKEPKLRVDEESRQPLYTEEEKIEISRLAAELYKQKNDI